MKDANISRRIKKTRKNTKLIYENEIKSKKIINKQRKKNEKNCCGK